MSENQPPRRRSTPRPEFDEPTVIRAGEAPRHLWGDEGSGFVSDRVYLSTGQLHVLEFTLPPGGAFRHSETNPTVFAGDVAYIVLDGAILLIDPATGETHEIGAGEIGFFRRDTWHHALNPSAAPARVLEYFSPPPARGTASTYGRGKQPPEVTYVDRRFTGRWPAARAERDAQARIRHLTAADHLLTVVDHGGFHREGIAISTEFLDVAHGSVAGGHVGASRAFDCETMIFVETGTLHVDLTDLSAHAWHDLGAGDALFLPPDTRHRLVALESSGAAYWRGGGHVPHDWNP